MLIRWRNRADFQRFEHKTSSHAVISTEPAKTRKK
jgi:hypothetical protein